MSANARLVALFGSSRGTDSLWTSLAAIYSAIMARLRDF